MHRRKIKGDSRIRIWKENQETNIIFKCTFNFCLSIYSKANVSKTPSLLQVLAQKIAFLGKVWYLVLRLARFLCHIRHGWKALTTKSSQMKSNEDSLGIWLKGNACLCLLLLVGSRLGHEEHKEGVRFTSTFFEPVWLPWACSYYPWIF